MCTSILDRLLWIGRGCGGKTQRPVHPCRRHSDSVLAGFLFCSVDLEVFHDSFFLKKKEKRWKWTRARPLIKKGGYLAFVGPAGVSLRGPRRQLSDFL